MLAVEVIALVGLRGLQQAPRLVSVVYLVISAVAVLRDSPLLRQNRLDPSATQAMPSALGRRVQRVLLRRQRLVIFWTVALAMELLWQLSLEINPSLAVQLSVLHLVGFTGGIVLNSLLVLDPAAFNLQDHGHALPDGIGHAPAMLGAAFASLTTVGSPVLASGSLTSLTGSVGITIVGQLYVAILIAGVLGKPRKLAAAPKAEHPQVRRAAGQIRLRQPRRWSASPWQCASAFWPCCGSG